MEKKTFPDIRGLPGLCTMVFPDLSEVPIGSSVYVVDSSGRNVKVTKLSVGTYETRPVFRPMVT